MRPPAMDTSDLTQSTKLLAERLEPRLAAGAKTFQTMRYVVAGLAPLVVVAFLFGVWAISLAKKSDVSDVTAVEAARHAELERRTSVLEAQRAADGKALDALGARLQRIDDVQFDIRLRLGAPSEPPVVNVKPAVPRHPRAAPPTGSCGINCTPLSLGKDFVRRRKVKP